MINLFNNSEKKQLYTNILTVFVVLVGSLYLYFLNQENFLGYFLCILLCGVRFFTNPRFNEKNAFKMYINTYLFILGFCLVWEPPILSSHCILFFFISILLPVFDLFRMKKTQKSKTLALVLCLFLGWCGAHKFYLKKQSAWLYLLFFWTAIPAIFAIWDFIVILFVDTDCLATNFEDRLKTTLKSNSFVANKTIEIKNDVLAMFSDSDNKILFYYDNPYGKSQVKIIHYSDILDFELCTDKNSRLQGRGMAAFTGAAITDSLGLSATAGAVIGSVTGDRKVLESITSIIVNIKINDLYKPIISFQFLDSEVDKTDNDYQKALTKAQELIATLTYIKNKVQKEMK